MKIKRQDGFTIIEVVLVLAIAGLIFLMVFIALPALQRGQRDTQRKNDVSRMLTQLVNYSSSNSGSIPTTANFYAANTGFVLKYLGGTSATTTGADYIDPLNGTGYVAVAGDLSVVATNGVIGNIHYSAGSICGVSGALGGGTPRQYAIQIVLESQSATAPYCVDNG